jgi:hypothetical protein
LKQCNKILLPNPTEAPQRKKAIRIQKIQDLDLWVSFSKPIQL